MNYAKQKLHHMRLVLELRKNKKNFRTLSDFFLFMLVFLVNRSR